MMVFEMLKKELEHRHPLLPASPQWDLTITLGTPAVAPESQPGDAPGQAYAGQVYRRHPCVISLHAVRGCDAL